MDELSTTAVVIAHRAAARAWDRAGNLAQRGFDHDDLRQEAVVHAWLWLRDHGYDPSYDRELAALLYQRISLRLIDYMRHVNPLGPRGAPWPTPLSLDVEVKTGGTDSPSNRDTLADLLVDDTAAGRYKDVEDRHDLELAFRSWQGPEHYAEIAWLHAQGHTLADIGQAFGVGESRASQIRGAFIATVRRRWARPDGDAVAA